MKFHSAYSKRTRKPFSCVGPSETKQAFKNECDINFLLRNYNKTGLISHVNKHQGQYTDLPENIDYHTALTAVINAQATFDSLPSKLRKRFFNSPHSFLEFVSNPDNHDEMIKLGLTTAGAGIPQPHPAVAPAPAKVVPDPPAKKAE